MEEKLRKANELLIVQGARGTLQYDDYMRGMYNGMELIISIFEDRNPEYKGCKGKQENKDGK